MHFLKSLFFGVAASLVAITTAGAQSIVVEEPDDVRYVRVCDAYGSGYFFIPGTETCIRAGGFVRSVNETIGFENSFEGTSILTFGRLSLPPFNFPPFISTFSGRSEFRRNLWAQQAALNVDVRNETDWGTLRSLYRLEAGPSNVDTDVRMDTALISLAGFRAGYAGANYWSSNHNFGAIDVEPNFVFDRLGAGADSILPVDGFYGFNSGTMLDYTIGQNGLMLTVGIEDPRLFRGRFSNRTNNGLRGPFRFNNPDRSTDDSVNFYAGLNYSTDYFEFAFTAVRDALAFDVKSQDQGGWAYKFSSSIDLSELLPGIVLSGFYMHDGNYDTDYVHTNGLTSNPDSIWGAVVNLDFTEELKLWGNYWRAESDRENLNLSSIFSIRERATEELEMFGIGLNWYPKAAPGFSIKGAYINGRVLETLDSELSSFVFSSIFNIRSVSNFDGFRVTVRRDF